MTVELYGHYMSKGLCPQLVTRPQETTCLGNGDCGSMFKECSTAKGKIFLFHDDTFLTWHYFSVVLHGIIIDI